MLRPCVLVIEKPSNKKQANRFGEPYMRIACCTNYYIPCIERNKEERYRWNTKINPRSRQPVSLHEAL